MAYWQVPSIGAIAFLTIISQAPKAVADLPLTENYFGQPPQLLDVYTTNNTEDRPADYRFRFEIPATAEQPIAQMIFTQVEGFGYPRFSESRTSAVVNLGERAEAPLPLVDVDDDRGDKTLILTFDPPVEPGQRITVVLRARHNPGAGTYLYDITALPPGAAGLGQRLGIGRLQFYERRFTNRWVLPARFSAD